MELEQARTVYALAVAHQRLGVDAGRTLQRAATWFTSLGAVRWAEAASSAGGRPARVDGLDLLTPTERRVADAAASGRTTAAIAAELGVSPRTVEFHLRAVYRKLGVSRRAEFVALMVDGTRR